MRVGRKSAIAIGVFILLAAGVLVARWYESRTVVPGESADSLVVAVTSGEDRGPGSLREALFVAASADHEATVSIQTRRITLETALPPVGNAHGIRIISVEPGAEIDASALGANAVFDVAGKNTWIEGLAIRNCAGPAIILRAARFRLQSTTIEACDVGVDIAENAADALLERNRFAGNRVGVRLAAATRNTVVARNDFTGHKDAGLWAVRGDADPGATPVNIRDNRFTSERIGIVAGNVAALIERNTFTDSREAAIHLVGAGAHVRGNRISGGAAMGIVAENSRGTVIESNEIDRFTAYGIMVRGSANALVRANRIHNCGYGLAFVLGDSAAPSTAVENTIIEPQFNGIDVVGDSPILRRNKVVRPRVRALHVAEFEGPDGKKVAAKPFLENNSFQRGAASTSAAAGGGRGAVR